MVVDCRWVAVDAICALSMCMIYMLLAHHSIGPMAESRKSRITAFIGETEEYLRDTLYTQPKEWLVASRERIRDLPKTNYDLGVRFMEQHMWRDAMFRFRVVLYLNPQYPNALFNLSCTYFQLGNMAKARDALKQVLKETPQNIEAVFMLGAIDPDALTPEQRPTAMPQDMVVRFFSSIATNYNMFEAENQYRGGILVADQVKPLLPQAGITVVDLGCGSGIASIPYRASASQIAGIEITPAMVQQAHLVVNGDKKQFDEVFEIDIARVGEVIVPASIDLVLLVNVVQFVGALDAVIAQAALITKPGGIVALTVEPYANKDGFGLVAVTGRFGHGLNYVTRLAASHGLGVVKQVSLALYPGGNADLIVLRKGQ
jgi:predicted TPR repeat methyltransferase